MWNKHEMGRPVYMEWIGGSIWNDPPFHGLRKTIPWTGENHSMDWKKPFHGLEKNIPWTRKNHSMDWGTPFHGLEHHSMDYTGEGEVNGRRWIRSGN